MNLQTKMHSYPSCPNIWHRAASEMQESLWWLQQLRGCVQLSSCPHTHCCTLLCSSWPRPMLVLIVDKTFKIQTSSDQTWGMGWFSTEQHAALLSRHISCFSISLSLRIFPFQPADGLGKASQLVPFSLQRASVGLLHSFWHWYCTCLAEHQVIRQLLWLRYSSGFLQGSSSHTWTGSPACPLVSSAALLPLIKAFLTPAHNWKSALVVE